MSDLSGRLAPVIHKALLADGVQLTGKELGPVSVAISAYIKNNFEAVQKDVNAELAAEKTVTANEKKVAEPSTPAAPWKNKKKWTPETVAEVKADKTWQKNQNKWTPPAEPTFSGEKV